LNKQILLSTIVVAVFIFLIGSVVNFEAYSEESAEATLEIKSSKPQFFTDESTIPVLIIVNNNANSTITISDISISSVYFDFKNRNFEKPDIASKSSKSIDIYLKPQTENSKGNYSSAITIDYKKDGETYSVTKLFELVIIDRASLIQKISYTNILLLLALYYIPAQIIERIIPLFRPITHKITDILDKDDKPHLQNVRIDELTKHREQLISILKKTGTTEEIKRTISKVSSDGINITEKETKTTTLDDKAIQTKINAINKLLVNAKEKVSSHKLKKENVIWVFATIIAFVPGIIMSSFGIGLLQVLGHQDVFTYDVFINALFIGSGTKPIHDIIKVIKEARS